MSHWVFILRILFLLWVGYCLDVGLCFFQFGPYLFSPLVYGLTSTPDMSLHCSCHDTARLPSSLPCIIFSLSLRYLVFLLGLFSYHLGLPQPILFLWTSLACFIPWGILISSHSFLFPTFPWVFAKSFELPRPNYHILYFWVYWPLNQPHLLIHFFGAPSAHLCLLFTSYNSHGLITSFFGAPLGPFAFFGTLLLFYGPVYH